MKVHLTGFFDAQSVTLDWEDGHVHGDVKFVGMLKRAALVNQRKGFPTTDGFVFLDDWLSHSRGFVLCAGLFLKGVETDWVDEEMKDVILKS